MIKKKTLFIIGLALLLVVLFVIALFVGSSKMSLKDGILALFNHGSNVNERIIYNIRMPRILASIIVGASLGVAGLIMQTTLNNPMASPSTLGISNAAAFGANLSIILGAGGFLYLGGNINNFQTTLTPFNTSLFAFLFSFLAIFAIILLNLFKKISSTTMLLIGIAMGTLWSAGTTLLQFFATDVGLSSAFIWTFGDLARATYQVDLIIFIIFIICFIVVMFMYHYFNLALSGEKIALSSGLNLKVFRLIALTLSSLLTAAAVSFFGVIGFIGIIASHMMKRLIGYNHLVLIPATALSGAIILLFADILARTISPGVNLPVGALTVILGAPFFIILIIRRKDI